MSKFEHRWMCDIETMGTGPAAAIGAIAVCRFDPSYEDVSDEFYVKVDLSSSVSSGLTLEAGTVEWWLKQSHVARQFMTSPGRPLGAALTLLSEHMLNVAGGVRENNYLWGNGSDFDNVILASAYRATGIQQPWGPYNNRCYRTLKNLRPDVKHPEFQGTKHHALDDAIHQARHAIMLLNSL